MLVRPHQRDLRLGARARAYTTVTTTGNATQLLAANRVISKMNFNSLIVEISMLDVENIHIHVNPMRNI